MRSSRLSSASTADTADLHLRCARLSHYHCRFSQQEPKQHAGASRLPRLGAALRQEPSRMRRLQQDSAAIPATALRPSVQSH
jgi:hypothetical protein